LGQNSVNLSGRERRHGLEARGTLGADRLQSIPRDRLGFLRELLEAVFKTGYLACAQT
jgi:hypothetical protein